MAMRARWLFLAVALSSVSARGQLVTATVETAPAPSPGEALDDPAIWIHPEDPSLSLIIGTDIQTGLVTYGLDGAQVQHLPDGPVNNVDVRYDFRLGRERVDLVAATLKDRRAVALYRVDPETRRLESAGPPFETGMVGYGLGMYVSPVSGKYFVFVTSFEGQVQQFELEETSDGGIGAKLVRTLNVGSRTEGCVADDELGVLFLAQEDVGVWKYDAEPDGEVTGKLVDAIGGGHLEEAEGLALYYASDKTGFLIVSNQDWHNFVVYEREGDNRYVMTFRIIGSGTIDGVTKTDGIEVTNVDLGPGFPFGVFVAQDDFNDGAPQNFKLVPWESIAAAHSPALPLDVRWNPRTRSVTPLDAGRDGGEDGGLDAGPADAGGQDAGYDAGTAHDGGVDGGRDGGSAELVGADGGCADCAEDPPSALALPGGCACGEVGGLALLAAALVASVWRRRSRR